MTATQTTDERISWQTFQQNAPEVVASLRAITQAIKASTLEPELIELLKIRASQINGCAFCVQFHLNDARKLNIPAPRLDLLATWRDAGLYTARESAALAWTEALTLQAHHPIDEAAFAAVAPHFSEQELVFLTAAIGQINCWNRIAAPFRFAPPIPQSGERQ
jgi:AhpD family alkylhydroperoxidase